MRWRTILFCLVVMLIACGIIFCEIARAQGYHASFEGVPDVCASNMLTRESTIGEWCGNKIDGSGNWKDASGANLVQYSEALDNAAWTKVNVTVTADQVRLRDGTLKAELLEPTAADSYLYQDVAGTVGQKYICLFDIRSVTGNVALSIHVYDQSHGTILGAQAVTVTEVWQLFRVEGTLVTGDTHAGCVLGGNSTWSTGEAIYAGRGWVVDEDVDSSIGRYHPTDATTKPRLNLSPSNAPTLAKSDRQGLDGNRLEARELNGTSQYYSRTHHASMNVNDTDHTYTFYVEQDVGADTDTLFAHGVWDTDGLYIDSTGAIFRAWYSSAGSNVGVSGPAITSADGKFHTVHLVRNGNTATMYVDGVAGTPVDVTGEGIDVSRSLYIGVYDGGGGAWWEGRVAYARLDAKALSTEERAYDREVLSALASNQRYNALAVSRSTTAYAEYADGTMAEIPVNTARVGGDGGGLEIEAQCPNLMKQSQDFSTTWSTTQATVSTDVAVAPDGKTTVDGIVGAAITNQHGVCQNQIDLTVDSYVFHIWAKPGDQNWIYLYLTTVANATAYFNVATGFVGTTGAAIDNSGIEPAWGGFYHAWIVFTGTVAQHTFCVYSAEADGDNQFLGDGATINTYVWQAQVEPGTFPTSIIPTTTSAETRTADNVTLDPHPGEPWKQVLPESYGDAGQADKLSVYFEARCRWSGSTDVGSTRYLFEIGGDTGTASLGRNHIFFYVDATARIFGWFGDDLDADHFVRTDADPIVFSEWFSVRFVLDFSDLSRMDMWVNGSNSGLTYGGNTGSEIFDTTNVLVRFGQRYSGTINSFCRTRRHGVWNAEVRAP